MTEKLKYKVGDKVLVEAEIIEVDNDNKETEFPYRVVIGKDDSSYNLWLQDELLIEPQQKPKITQAVMEYYLKYRDRDWVFGTWFSFESIPHEVKFWLYSDKKLRLQRQHALATLIAYGPEAVEVEKEKKYRVKIKRLENTDIALQYLIYDIYGYRFEINTLVTKDSQYEFTKQELIEAGFEGVFDNPMFEVEEVE